MFVKIKKIKSGRGWWYDNEKYINQIFEVEKPRNLTINKDIVNARFDVIDNVNNNLKAYNLCSQQNIFRKFSLFIEAEDCEIVTTNNKLSYDLYINKGSFIDDDGGDSI